MLEVRSSNAVQHRRRPESYGAKSSSIGVSVRSFVCLRGHRRAEAIWGSSKGHAGSFLFEFGRLDGAATEYTIEAILFCCSYNLVELVADVTFILVDI